MVQELLAEKVIDLYETHAPLFRQLRPVNLFEKTWLDRFLSLIPKQGTILDIGCGNGVPIADYFLRKGFKVEGIDSSKTMIGYCRERFPAQRWLVGDMRELNLGYKFDALIAWDSFFHLTRPQQRKMFRLFSDHTYLGAVLMFTSGTGNGEAIGTFGGEPLYHASLAHDEYRQLLNEQGFSVVNMVVEDPQCEGRTVWLVQKTLPAIHSA